MVCVAGDAHEAWNPVQADGSRTAHGGPQEGGRHDQEQLEGDNPAFLAPAVLNSSTWGFQMYTGVQDVDEECNIGYLQQHCLL